MRPTGEMIAAFFSTFEICGIVENRHTNADEWIVYFEPPHFPEDMEARLRQWFATGGMGNAISVSIGKVARENWQDGWRAYFKPVLVSPTLAVLPPWEQDNPDIPSDALRIVVEPGMAFGTGTHATTQLCLQMAEGRVRAGSTVLDIGTGSGILCIGARILGAGFCVGFDTDPDITENAAGNLRLNAIPPGSIQFFIGTLSALRKREFDTVFCNMLSHEFLPVLPVLRAFMHRASLLFLSGLLVSEREEIHAALTGAGFEEIEFGKLEEWGGFVARPR